jgi:23S rRNA-/tRNA-specific pseudouridylate synthase
MDGGDILIQRQQTVNMTHKRTINSGSYRRRRWFSAHLTVMIMFCAARVYALQHHTPLFNPSRAFHYRRSSMWSSTTLYGFSRHGEKRTNTQPQRPRRKSASTQQPNSTQQVERRSSKSSLIKLEKPEVIFSNNHVLVVNKPAGWKSQPGDGGGQMNSNQNSSSLDQKCLLTYLQSQALGGGSLNNFLTPTHRLDQPCTGVLIFAKNGKAASRVQVAWGKRKVKKIYWVVVEGGENGLDFLISRSKLVSGSGKKPIYQLSGMLKSVGGGKGGGSPRSNKGGGGTVICKPLSPNQNTLEGDTSNNGFRVCHIEWEHLKTLPTSNYSTNAPRYLLSVSTDTGAKHQVRALLGLVGGAPIAGDLRYGDNYSNHRGGRVDGPLPDGSVALHARSVFLPTVALGGMEFLKDEPFIANLPGRWKEFFGIREQDVKGLE